MTNGVVPKVESFDVLEVLGRRWMPLIIVELRNGAIGFRELRRRCASMSSSVLTQRLNELRDCGLAAPDDFGAWELTQRGDSIGSHLRDLVTNLAELSAEGPEPGPV